MKTVVSDISALYYWRRTMHRERVLASKFRGNPFGQAPTSTTQGIPALLETGAFGPFPVHAAVDSQHLRIDPRNFIYHVHTMQLPGRLFRTVIDDLLIVSPELCFVELAARLPLNKAIELGLELCGRYSLVEEAPKGMLQWDVPLTTPTQLQKAIEQLTRMHGIQNARAAVKHIVSGSESPMETRQYMFACLPKRLGGYGLRHGVQLNGEITLTEDEALLAGRSTIRCDLCYPKQHVGLEYESKEEHLSALQFEKDLSKRNVLTGRKTHIFTVTPQQILYPDAFDIIMRNTAKLLGVRLRAFPADWEARRAKLRKDVFESMNIPIRPEYLWSANYMR